MLISIKPSSRLHRYLLTVAAVLMSLTVPAPAQRIKRVSRPLLRPSQFRSPWAFPSLKWRVTLGMAGNTVPVIADLDLDGTMDILLPAVDGNALYRLTQNGNAKWRVALPDPITAGVTLGDVDRDGALDILVAAGRTLYCFDAGGAERWHATVEGTINSLPTIADLDGDGNPEVIFGANDNVLHVLTGQGQPKWTFPTKSWIVGGVAVGDLDGDGQLEVVFGSMDYNIYCVNATGTLRWKYATADWVESSPCIADLDRNGSPDVVCASDDGQLYCLSALGTVKWKEPYAEPQHMRPGLAVADLDGDGTLETIIAPPSGMVSVFTAFGDHAWSASVGSAPARKQASAAGEAHAARARHRLVSGRPLAGGAVTSTIADNGDATAADTTETAAAAPDTPDELDTPIAAAPLVADLNGDGWQDVLIAGGGGQLTSIDTWGRTQWTASLGQTVEATPLIADLNGNGKYEIYVANLMSAHRDSGFFSCFEVSAKGGAGLWMTAKGDPYRTAMAANARDYAGSLRHGGDYASAWEPFGTGYRPRTGTQPPRSLRVTALPLDDIKGNHDGALDPGETALFKVQVINEGQGASYDNLLTLDLGGSLLSLDRTHMFLGWIAPHARKTAIFRITAPPLAKIIEQMNPPTPFRDVAAIATPLIPPATAATARTRHRKSPVAAKAKLLDPVQSVKLQVTESGVQAAVAEANVFNVPPLPPTLHLHQWQIVDNVSSVSFGNGNGQLDSGETVVLRLLLSNDNLTTAKLATATVTASSADVLVATPLAKMVDVVPYGGRHVSFSLRVARQLVGKTVSLKIATQVSTTQSAPAGAWTTETITVPLHQNAVDTTAPSIALYSPLTRVAVTSAPRMPIAGVVSDASDIATFSFDKQSVPIAQLKRIGPNRYRFWYQRELHVGENVFPITASDKAGNSVNLWVRVVRRPTAGPGPAQPARH